MGYKNEKRVRRHRSVTPVRTCEAASVAVLRAELEGVNNSLKRSEHVRQAAENRILELIRELSRERETPIELRLHCPACGELHVDEGVWAVKPHKTHECQRCGMLWRPCARPTVGVRFIRVRGAAARVQAIADQCAERPAPER